MTDLDSVGLGGREHWSVEPRPLPGERRVGRAAGSDGRGAGDGSKRPRTGGRSAARWPVTAALAVALLAAAASLHLLIEPGPWAALIVIVVAAVLGSAALLRAIGVPRYLASAGGLVVLVLLLTLVFAARTAILGIVPTPDTIGTLLAVGEQAGDEIYRRSAPVPPNASIVFVTVASIGALAGVLDVLANALRMPAVTGLPLLVLVSVPGAVLAGEFSMGSFAITALAWFAVLAADTLESGRDGGWRGSGLLGGSQSAPPTSGRPGQVRRPGTARATLASAGALAVGAVVVSLVAPAIVPGLTSATFPTASGSGQGGSRIVNPILDLGHDLRRPVDVEALRYSTTSTEPLYFKVTTLSRFEGDEWAPSPLRPPDGNAVDAIGPDLGADPAVPVEEVEARVQVEGSSSAWLPAPYAPRSVSGLDGSWRWSEQGLAIRSSDSNSRDQSYTVRSELPRPTAEQLAAVPAATDDALAPFLEVPVGTPAVVATTTADVLAGIDGPYEQALALQEFFIGGQFLYSEESPVEQGYDGSGADVVGEFLRVGSGYCVHFASAMAIMAREAGIPSRVAVGYLPGDQVGRDGDLITYRVGSHDLHSWPELYFTGIGWLPFEPTPGRGEAAPYALPSAAPSTAPTPSASPTPAAEATSSATPAPTASAAPGANSQSTVGIPWAGLGVTALVLLVLVLLATPSFLRRARRAGRLRALAAGDAPAGTAWREAEDRALDLRLRVPDTESPRE
ncbi:transglutaminase domain-containing protein, partial [Clavibacter michiganensis]